MILVRVTMSGGVKLVISVEETAKTSSQIQCKCMVVNTSEQEFPILSPGDAPSRHVEEFHEGGGGGRAVVVVL